MTSVKSVIGVINDLFFPSSCAACGLSNIGSGNLICQSCFDSLKLFPSVLYARDFDDRAIFWDSLHSFSHYDKVMMKLIHEYKHGRRHGLASFFAAHLVKMIENGKASFDLVTSVPPSQKKMKKRGFDPSQVISRAIASMGNVPYKALMRESGTHGEQKTLGADDRYCNAIGRFVFTGEPSLEGKNIILVDDVMTTGATINESARILKKNGAGIVLSLTVARVDIRKI